MKKLVILVVFLIIFSSISFAKVVDIPKVSEGSGEEIPIPIVQEEEIVRYYYSGNSLVYSSNREEGKYYFQDRLGSNRVSVNLEGEVSNFKSLPYGQVIDDGIQYGFTGKEKDESGLHYFSARYYDSDLGKFTSVDPVAENEPYAYVGNNPMMFVDPDGTMPIIVSTANPTSTKLTGEVSRMALAMVAGEVSGGLYDLYVSHTGNDFIMGQKLESQWERDMAGLAALPAMFDLGRFTRAGRAMKAWGDVASAYKNVDPNFYKGAVLNTEKMTMFRGMMLTDDEAKTIWSSGLVSIGEHSRGSLQNSFQALGGRLGLKPGGVNFRVLQEAHSRVDVTGLGISPLISLGVRYNAEGYAMQMAEAYSPFARGAGKKPMLLGMEFEPGRLAQYNEVEWHPLGGFVSKNEIDVLLPSSQFDIMR